MVCESIVSEADRERVELRYLAAATSTVLRGRTIDLIQSWELTIAGALYDRCDDRDRADTLAAVGMGVFRAAVMHWVAEPGTELPTLVERGFDALRD